MGKKRIRILAVILAFAVFFSCGAVLLAEEEPPVRQEPPGTAKTAALSFRRAAREDRGADLRRVLPGEAVPSAGEDVVRDEAPVPETPPDEPALVVGAQISFDGASAPARTQEDTGRYAALRLSAEDLELLARIVYLEARGEPYEGQVAVAEVVLNRVLSELFPDTVAEVLYQTGQFTPAPYLESTVAGEEQYEAAADAADGLSCVTGEDVMFFSGAPYNERVYIVIGGHYFCCI